MVLGLIGEKDTAVITSIYRQGGQRNESIPNRYTYSVNYSFKLPDGSIEDGFSYKIGDAIYVKASGSSLTPVRYLKAFPALNALESDTTVSAGKFVLIAVGVLLIVHKRHREKNTTESQ